MPAKHPEPWEFQFLQDAPTIIDANGKVVADWCVGEDSCEECGDYLDEAACRRIVACVNACRDLPDDILKKINNGEAKIALLAHPDPLAPEIVHVKVSQ